jgi:hypothetical protein
MRVFKITGKVISSKTKKGINVLRVEAWDKDLLVDDMVGSAITGEGGVFRIQFDESYFKELFFDRRPDLFFKIFKGEKLIKSTKDSVLWNVDREDIEQTIEIEEANDMVTPKNKAVFVRQRGSEVFKFVTLRPFQRQDEATVEKRKVLCYKPRDEEKSEFHRALLHAKEHPYEGSGPRETMLAKAVEFIENSGSTFVRNIHDLSNPQAPRSSQSIASKSSIGLLEEWIFRTRKSISHENLLSEIKSVYQKDNINDIVQSPDFQTDIYRLQDSIMALAIVPSHPHSQRDRLVNALRICRIIERITQGDPALMQPYGIDRAMKAPVVLPTDIFPLPPAKEQEIEAPSEPDREGEEELRMFREKRNALKTAIEELTHLRPVNYVSPPQPPAGESNISTFKKEDTENLSASTKATLKEYGIDLTTDTFRQAMSRLEVERGRVAEAKAPQLQAATEELLKLVFSRLPKSAEGCKPLTLKQKAIDQLRDTSRQVIQELGFDLASDPVPHVVNVLEEELGKVGAQLFRPPKGKRVIRHGISRMEFLPGFEAYPWPADILEPIRVPQTKGLVKPSGVGEYNTVQQTLLRYEPGEIAHIENVLRGEYKDRVHRRLRRIEEEITYEEERNTVTEKDLQSTDRFELKQEASETIKEEHKADAGVTVKYDGPTVDVEAKAGYTYTHAKEESKKTSVSYARDVTQRSVSKLEEKVREVRVQKSIEEFEETNTHGIDNKEKADHAVGIYRWVDKIYEAQVIGYGERLFFDFVIPEPAAFYIYALTHGATTDLAEPLPPMVDENGEPCGEEDPNARSLRPEDIERSNYQSWLCYYNATGIKPYPEMVKIVAKSWKAEDWKSKPEGNATKYELSEVMELEDGYKAESAYAILNFPKTSGMCLVPENLVARLAIGRQIANLRNCVGLEIYPDHVEYNYWFEVEIDNLNEQGSIPLSVAFLTEDQSNDYDPINFEDIGPLTLEIKCISSDEKRKSWQLETYDAVIQAYLKKKAEYEEKLAMAAIQEGISISGRNPEQNREIEETELKRWALSMITGQHFELFNAMQTDRQGYPGINFAEAEAEGSYTQFFEHAFEWPLMTYLFYPYFWGRRQAPWQGGPTWVDKITQIQDVDPLFEKFLKAGAARVRMPVRPGYEEAVLHYLSTSELWNGEEKPTVDDPLYVSIIEEIQQQQGAFVEKTGGTVSVTQGSPEITGTGTSFDPASDVEREIYIEGKRYVIAEIEETEQQITLTEPYRGETKQYARYYIGARLVGGPWEVRIPTSLVYLQEDATLPEFGEEE